MFFENIVTDFGGPLEDGDWQRIREIEAENNFYHSINFPEGEGWTGRFNIKQILSHYHLPEDFTGKSVLDVGPADGFFAFLAEQRNAKKVLAMQPSSVYPGLAYAHRNLCSKVGFCQKSIYDLNNISSDQDRFDIVFCFSVLMHIPDLYSAITGLFEATREVAYIATYTDVESDQGSLADKPYVRFGGEVKKGEGMNQGTFHNYWYPNSLALVKMAELAGFEKIDILDGFYLSQACTPPRDTGYQVLIRCSR